MARQGRSSTTVTNVAVQMRIDPATSIVENIKHMRPRLLDNIGASLVDVAATMQSRARKQAQSAYESHPDRHPSERYPSGRTAAQSISANVVRTHDGFVVSLGYGADVIQTVGSRAPIDYAGILEAEYWGPGTAVIGPSFGEFQDVLLSHLRGAGLFGFKSRRPGPGKGAPRI